MGGVFVNSESTRPEHEFPIASGELLGYYLWFFLIARA
jgi:hypothetical protein